jgi:hypothetical protein
MYQQYAKVNLGHRPLVSIDIGVELEFDDEGPQNESVEIVVSPLHNEGMVALHISRQSNIRHGRQKLGKLQQRSQ